MTFKVGSFFQSGFFHLVFSGFYRPGRNRFYPLLDKTGKKTLHKLKTIENPESYKIIYLNFLYLNVTRIVALIHLLHIYTFIIFYIICFMLYVICTVKNVQWCKHLNFKKFNSSSIYASTLSLKRVNFTSSVLILLGLSAFCNKTPVL